MERTNCTMANVIFDKMSQRQSSDGKNTMRQEIEHIRANNPDKLAPIGEGADNMTSWAKAENAGVYMHSHKIDMFDDGTFENETLLKLAFTKYKDDTPDFKRYNSAEPILGKFNAGLTDSAILMGEDASLIHHFGEGNYKKTIFNAEKARRDNNISANISIPSDDEIEEFLRFQYLLNPNYSQKTGRGTLLTFQNLLKKNTQETFTNVCQFMYGLYSPECHQQTTFNLYNNINPNKESEGYIIKPNDLSFGALGTAKTVYVYNDETEEAKKIYTESKNVFKQEVYKFSFKIFFFDPSQMEAERKIFNNKTDEERVGFSVRRGGRLVSGIAPLRWGLSTGANRAKGIRINIDFPPCAEADNDFSIGTFKKVTHDTWKHFNSYLKCYLEKEFRDITRLQDEDRKTKQTIFVAQYTEKLKNIKNLTQAECAQILEETKNTLETELNKKEVIQKKSGNAYTSITSYISALGVLAKSFEPKPAVVEVVAAKPVEVVVAKPVAKPVVEVVVAAKPVAKPAVEVAKPIIKKELSYDEWLIKVGGSEAYLKGRYNIEKRTL